MAFKKQSSTAFGVLTPEREEVYKNAMEYLQDPVKLRDLAANFEKEGLKAQAHWMRKRAEWRARPDEVKAKHNAIFEKALESENIQAILDVAKIFESLTATIKAAQLRERAKSLKVLRDEAKTVETTAEDSEEVNSNPNAAADMSRHTSEVVSKETSHVNGINGAVKKEGEDGGLQANPRAS
jgi:hypothetical protein